MRKQAKIWTCSDFSSGPGPLKYEHYFFTTVYQQQVHGMAACIIKNNSEFSFVRH